MIKTIIEESVLYLFAELKSNKISFVVLRNYDRLPDIGNDLDVALQRKDIQIVRNIFSSEFYKSRWSWVCEVKTHNSTVDEQNIFVFKFFNRKDEEYMQIDFFQGFLFKGQPFFTITDMLKNIRHFNSFPVVDVAIELRIKYFQILSALNQNQMERVAKYSEQAAELQMGYKISGNDFDLLNDYLRQKNYLLFSNHLISFRRRNLYRLLINNPFRFFANILHRFGSFYNFFVLDPFAVKCVFSPNTDRKMLGKVLDHFVKVKCFRGYYIANETKFLIRLQSFIKFAQGGGIIISYNKKGFEAKNEQDLQDYIIKCFVSKHTALF